MNLNKKNTKQIMFLIIFAALMLWIVFNYKMFIDLVGFIIGLLTPLIVGMIIAFVINVPMKKLEEKVFKIKKRKHKKLIRAISLILSILLIFGIIVLILFLVIPEFIEALINLSEGIPKSYKFIDALIGKIKVAYPELGGYLKNIDVNSIAKESVNGAGALVSLIIAFISDVISKLVVFFIGFIISIYILADKEKLGVQIRKTLTAFFGKEVSKNITNIARISNNTFTNFLTGQCLDSCLIGFLLFIILSVMKLPYALILGVLFAITALIPYVGAFITLAIGVVLIGVTNPMGALWYVIVFLVLQQFDDNFTHPRIVGGSVGLPALWAILAVLIGGSIFGFMGMVISIPLASILYSLFKNLVNEKIEEKNIDTSK